MTDIDRFHPAVSFAYFAAVLLPAMLFFNPLFLAVGIVCALCAGLCISGAGKILKTFLYSLPLWILVAVFNPIVSHGGKTALFTLFGGQFTLQALLYGVCSGGMLTLIMLWFASYNRIVTPEKFMYLFSRAAPSAAMVVTMTQRMIRLFTRRASAIARAQKTLLCDAAQGSLPSRFRNALRITSILLSWSMEDGLDTADSMKARGYGSAKRTFFAYYAFRPADAAALALILLLFAVGAGFYYSSVSFSFYPELVFRHFGLGGRISLFAYIMLCLLPVDVRILSIDFTAQKPSKPEGADVPID